MKTLVAHYRALLQNGNAFHFPSLKSVITGDAAVHENHDLVIANPHLNYKEAAKFYLDYRYYKIS